MIIVAWAVIVLLAGGMTMGDQQMMSAASPPPTAPTRQMPGLAHSVALICILTKPGMPRRQFMAEHSVGSSSSLSLSSSGIWALMIVAMMLPSALPAATYAGAQSLRWRRRRTMLEFVLGYAAAWLPVGTLILTATAGLRGSYAAWLVAMCVAAAWQLTPLKRQALLDCHRARPLAPYGGAALRAAVVFGVRNGWACVRSCWPLMVVMNLVPGLQIESMAAVTVLVAGEKLARRPRRAARHVGAALSTAVAVAGVLAVA